LPFILLFGFFAIDSLEINRRLAVNTKYCPQTNPGFGIPCATELMTINPSMRMGFPFCG
jgi:hypothetical protein